MGSSIKKTSIYVEELYPQKFVAQASMKKEKKKTFMEIVYRYIRVKSVVDVIRGRKVHFYTQCKAFQESMKLPLLIGQCTGLIPVNGILGTDVETVSCVESKILRLRHVMYHDTILDILPSWRYSILAIYRNPHNFNIIYRFELCSYRLMYNCVMCAIQFAATLMCLYKILDGAITVRKLGNLVFYLTTFITSAIFLQVARKWRHLLEQVTAARLDQYIDSSVKFKCYFATLTLFGSALFEHILVIIARVSVVMDCMETDHGVYPTVIEKMILWIFSSEVTYQFPMGIILLTVNFISTINWSYSYIFIICISLYLTSILEQINKKIKESEDQYYPPTYWRQLREDYNRATLLVRTFDDVIASVIFFSFASNLFFICLQLFNTLKNVKTTYENVMECPHYPNGPFGGAELITYYLYSLVFIIGRFLAVTLIASEVHTASLVAAPYLYSLSATSYCDEVQRFIQQIQGNFIALSGLNYFYVTKEHILSVAGTIVTYELVLLQIDG